MKRKEKHEKERRKKKPQIIQGAEREGKKMKERQRERGVGGWGGLDDQRAVSRVQTAERNNLKIKSKNKEMDQILVWLLMLHAHE